MMNGIVTAEHTRSEQTICAQMARKNQLLHNHSHILRDKNTIQMKIIQIEIAWRLK